MQQKRRHNAAKLLIHDGHLFWNYEPKYADIFHETVPRMAGKCENEFREHL